MPPFLDTPEFDEALRRDTDGSFHRAIEDYLQKESAAIKAALQQGMAPLDFERARKIEAALAKATDVVRFSAHLSRKS